MVRDNKIVDKSMDGARYLDLLAKTAKTSIKDTRRILLAIEALQYAFAVSPGKWGDYSPDRPSLAESTACDHAHEMMIQLAEEQPKLRAVLGSIRKEKYGHGTTPAI